MAEWPIAVVLKTTDSQESGGSNPSPTATSSGRERTSAVTAAPLRPALAPSRPGQNRRRRSDLIRRSCESPREGHGGRPFFLAALAEIGGPRFSVTPPTAAER